MVLEAVSTISVECTDMRPKLSLVTDIEFYIELLVFCLQQQEAAAAAAAHRGRRWVLLSLGMLPLPWLFWLNFFSTCSCDTPLTFFHKTVENTPGFQRCPAFFAGRSKTDP